ncbi:MAG: hypothetical protein ACREVF_01065, partial [Burkholderiales bacterium]
ASEEPPCRSDQGDGLIRKQRKNKRPAAALRAFCFVSVTQAVPGKLCPLRVMPIMTISRCEPDMMRMLESCAQFTRDYCIAATMQRGRRTLLI